MATPETGSRATVHAASVDQGNPAALWAAFTQTRSIPARENLFRHYLPYAQAIAARLFAGRLRDDVDFGDFLQLALVGLLESIDRFDPDQAVAFETFCTPRVKGSVLDGVERLTDAQGQISFMRRAQRERIASLNSGIEGGGEKHQDTFQRFAHLAAGLAIGYMLDDTGMLADDGERPADAISPWQGIAWRQTRERLAAAMTALPERDRRLVQYHYFYGLQFEQIADILGVSRPRISQLHRAALAQLKRLLGNRQRLYVKG
ncbi:sigma-70 family RNA polymerase sigma factor [Paraburkholderia sp. J10-1]|uniref:sigma-70 family RNA polymerase sigma factor n=1 Tax=Paraburkholderia sp. J10-1 TaxID=2805430 RepID=UPI002AB7CF6D|nr:sigma-70 family RNA polymerase sigma factor [Paraburkholderia sp. J10-1]